MGAWVVSHFPRNAYDTLLDGCFATGAITLLHDPTGKSEIAVERDDAIYNFWAVLRSDVLRDQLIKQLQFTPFSDRQFAESKKVLENLQIANDADDTDRIEYARALFVVARQSMAGRWEDFTPVSTSRLRRGMCEQVSAWLGAVDHLPDVAMRLMPVLLHHGDYNRVGRKYDKPRTLHYVDLPYLADSRVTPEVYRTEADRATHEQMLSNVTSYTHALVAISHNPHELYDEKLKGWRTATFVVPNLSSKKKTKDLRVEKLYMNYDREGVRIV